MSTPDFAGAVWRKSSRSTSQANCVEVGRAADTVGVRDSKNRHGGTVAFPIRSWRAFLTCL